DHAGIDEQEDEEDQRVHGGEHRREDAECRMLNAECRMAGWPIANGEWYQPAASVCRNSARVSRHTRVTPGPPVEAGVWRSSVSTWRYPSRRGTAALRTLRLSQRI